MTRLYKRTLYKGSVAEWSKALVLGTSQKWRGFESHHCHTLFGLQKPLETPGIEPGTSHMRSERSTTELHPHPSVDLYIFSSLVHIFSNNHIRARLAEWSKA